MDNTGSSKPGQGGRLLLLLIGMLGMLTGCQLRLPVEQQPVSIRFQPGDPAFENRPAPPLVPVWLLSDNYHTGLVFSYPWLLESGFIPPAGFPENAEFVAMSWGNVDAYSAVGLDSAWKWIRVLFTPTPSVMEMIPCNWHVVELLPGQQIWLKMVERERGRGLAHFLNQCTSDHPDGLPVVIAGSSWGSGFQLAGSHSYFIPRVCNIWTAQAIESMGFSLNAWNAVTARSLIRQVEAPPLNFAEIWPGGGRPESSVDPESSAGAP